MTQQLKNDILYCLRQQVVDQKFKESVIDQVRELPVNKSNKDVENDLKSRIIQA